MSFKVVETVLASAVAQNGTFTVGYPGTTDSGTFVGAYAHVMTALNVVRYAPADFTVSFGTSSITVTYKGATTLPIGTKVRLQFDQIGADKSGFDTYVGGAAQISLLTPVVMNLGAPDVADADGICASQSITALAGGTINGALASGGVATFDVPRNVVAAWTTSAVITVTGTDQYGKVLKESSASGTSLAGKKAFKTVTAVAFSVDVTSATVGSGDVLGLPIALPEKGMVVREMEDGATASAGTLLGAVRTTATATTGDIRGTYDPSSACDGAKAFQLLAFVPNPSDVGIAQYAG